MISSVVGVDIGADEPTPTLAPKRRRKVCVKSISGGSKRAQSSASAARSVSAKILSSEQKVKVGADREPDYVLDLSYAGRNRKKSKSSRRSSDSNSGDDDDDKEESDVELDAKTRNLLDSHPEQDADCPFDALIFFGDLNYRLDFPRFEAELLKERIQDISVGDTVEARALQEDVRAVLEYDQLTREKCRGRAFRGFSEGRIDFAPTFKYDRGSDQFDSSAKGRAPAWTDRILFKVWNRTTTRDSDGIKRAAKRSDPTAPEDISNSSTQEDQKPISISPPLLTLLEYNSIDNRHSDHRPVYSKFNLFL